MRPQPSDEKGKVDGAVDIQAAIVRGPLETLEMLPLYETAATSRRNLTSTREDVMADLRGCIGNPEKMTTLRCLLVGVGHAGIYRLDDHQVVERVAAEVCGGFLHLRKSQVELFAHAPGAQSGYQETAPARETAAPLRRTPPPRRAAPASKEPSTRSELPEAPTFRNVLQEQQADTLEAAAAEGYPFCEECARAKLELAAKAEGSMS